MLEAGPRTPSELAAMLGMPLSTLSTYLGAMLGRGDAKRIPNPTDGRSVRVVLTDRGRGGRPTREPAVHPGALSPRGEPRRAGRDVRARPVATSSRRSSVPTPQLDVEREPPRQILRARSILRHAAEGSHGRARPSSPRRAGRSPRAARHRRSARRVRARPRPLRPHRRPRTSRRPSRPARRAPRTWPRRATRTSTTSSNA